MPVSRWSSSVLSVVLVALIVLAAHVSPLLVAAAVLVVQALVAAAPRLADARGRSLATPRLLPALAAGVVATALALWPDVIEGAEGTRGGLGPHDGGVFSAILPAVVVGLFVAAVTQMLRTDGRRELTAALGYAVSLSVVAALAAGWVVAAQSLASPADLVVGAAGLVAGVLVWAIPGDRFVVGGAAVVAGAVAGAASTVAIDSVLTVLFGVAVGSSTALFAVLGQVLGRALIGGRRHASVGWGFPGAVSVALAPPVLILGQLLGALRL